MFSDKKGKQEPVIIEDEFSKMTIDELKNAKKTMEEKLQVTKKQRSYFQVERDQMILFYDTVRDQNKNLNLHIKNIEAQMEMMQNSYQNNIRVRQKIKNFCCLQE